MSSTFGQYPEWQRSGTITIFTTPEGANLPAGTVAEGFALLVRLQKDWFEFKQAKAGGEGVRCSSSKGAPLVFQIEEWGAATSKAVPSRSDVTGRVWPARRQNVRPPLPSR